MSQLRPRSSLPRVRMESPDSLFAADEWIDSPVPAPLRLLSCMRLPLEAAYPVGEHGTVLNGAHAFQRNEISYPDGSRFLAEVSANPSLGLPNVYDLDYLLGLLWLADQGAIESDGRFAGVTYADVIRATRPGGPLHTDKVDAAKRSFGRWAGTSVRTAMEMALPEGGNPRNRGRRAVSPALREREMTHWVLEYDVEAEIRDSKAYDRIHLLRLNPVWIEQMEHGLAAWIDHTVHNQLRSGAAKALYVQLALAAAEGRLPMLGVLPFERWEEMLGSASQEKVGKRAARFQGAIDALREAGVLGEKSRVHNAARGVYHVEIEPGDALANPARRMYEMGGIDPRRTRVLVWHLGLLGFVPAEARKLLTLHGLAVQEVLQRVHYERTVKQGVDARGERITRWDAWLSKALRERWSFNEPEYLAWREGQQTRLARDVIPGSAAPETAPPAALPRHLAAMEAPVESGELPLPDDLWGRALAALRSDVPEVSFRSWLVGTWLIAVEEDLVRVGTTNPFGAEWIRSRFTARLEELLSRDVGRPVRLVVETQTGP
jgi:hypothetical protein